MKTLVIHPFDSSTRFLGEIYKGMDWTVIRNLETSKKRIKEEIKNHDRIVMLGHGTEQGLCTTNGRWLIDSSMVYLLREKEIVAIWCNADVFVKKYNLKGKYSGMIISEFEEAMYMGVWNTNSKEIEDSNVLFAESIKKSINSDDFVNETLKHYVGESNVIDFNRSNIYQTLI